MTAPLIGLIGKKRVGKDTFAARLIEEHGFTRIAFADPLKEAALRLDPIVPPMFGEPVTVTPARAETWGLPRLSEIVARDGWELAKENPEIRRTLQEFGQEIRHLDPTFWIRAAFEQVEHVRSLSVPVVITDVRYENEADAVREAGGTLVRITRPGLDESDRHPSETALEDYDEDHYVCNCGTLAFLHRRADEVFWAAS